MLWVAHVAVTKDQARRFASQALTKGLEFAIQYEGRRKVWLHGPSAQSEPLTKLLEEVTKK